MDSPNHQPDIHFIDGLSHIIPILSLYLMVNPKFDGGPLIYQWIPTSAAPPAACAWPRTWPPARVSRLEAARPRPRRNREISMERWRFPWDLKQQKWRFHRIFSWDFTGKQWKFHGTRIGFHQKQWRFYGIYPSWLWNSIDLPRKRLQIDGFRQKKTWELSDFGDPSPKSTHDSVVVGPQ